MANENQKWTECFNNKFIEFFNDLINTFPDDKDFKMFKQSFNLVKLVDDKQPLKYFRVYGPKYKTSVETKNEEFFLSHDFKEEIEEAKNETKNSNISNQLMIKLKEYWKNLNEDNKEIIWKYLMLLYKINDKICI